MISVLDWVEIIEGKGKMLVTILQKNTFINIVTLKELASVSTEILDWGFCTSW